RPARLACCRSRRIRSALHILYQAFHEFELPAQLGYPLLGFSGYLAGVLACQGYLFPRLLCNLAGFFCQLSQILIRLPCVLLRLPPILLPLALLFTDFAALLGLLPASLSFGRAL